MNQEYLQTISRETGLSLEQLQDYVNITDKNQKKYICAYWLRGTCLFPKELCHHAHSFDDLNYTITSNRILQPYYSKLISERQQYFKLDKNFYVSHQSQKSEFVQKAVKKFTKSIGQDYEEGRYYSLKELRDNRKMRSTILTYTLLEDLIKFNRFIFQTLGPMSPIPKKLLVRELQRVGYCQTGSSSSNYIMIGGKTYKPGTILHHLQSYGVCFQTDIQVRNFKLEEIAQDLQKFDQTIQKSQEDNSETDDKLIQDEQIQDKLEGEEDDNDNDNINDDQEEETDMIQKEGDPWRFMIPIHSLQQTMLKFNILFHQVMENVLTLSKQLDYEILIIAVDRKVDETNEFHFPNTLEMVPHFEQILKMSNIPFDEYYESQMRPNYPSIDVFQNKNFDQCGEYISQIEKYFNQEQKQCLADYLNKPKCKFYLCKYWLRGNCVFKKGDCRLAHGAEDLQIVDFDNNFYHKQLEELQQSLKVNSQSLITVRTYRVLYYYQFELLRQGQIERDQIRTVFEIDQVKEFRDKIRKLIRYDAVIKFYHKISNGIPKRKSFFDKFYKYCGFYQTELSDFKVIKILLHTDTCFEREIEEDSLHVESQPLESPMFKTKETKKQKKLKELRLIQSQNLTNIPLIQGKKKIRALKKVTYIIPYRKIEVVQQYYTSLIIDIFLQEITMNLAKQDGQTYQTQKDEYAFLPLSEQTIKRQINRTDILIDMPGFYTYLRMSGSRINISDFIRNDIFAVLGSKLQSQATTTKDKRWHEISRIFNYNPHEFMILDDNMEGIEQFVFDLLKELIQKQKYVINVDKILRIVEQQFKTQQSQFQTNDKLKVFLRDNIVNGELIKLEFRNYYLQTYNQGLFIIINPTQRVISQVKQKQKKCKCGQSYLFPSDQSKLQVHNDKALENLRLQIIDMGLIDKSVRNTLIVDDNIKLQIAQEVFKHVNFVGVDFEGSLVDGKIWLAQLGIQVQGTQRLIIILDLMNAQYNQKDVVFHSQLLSFLSWVMQETTIRKVFHDCRRDSHALHQNGICTRNASDTSVTYALFQQITYFDQWKLQEINNPKQKSRDKSLNSVLRDIHQFNQPSLNDVLLNWNAMHSQNELKGQFHQIFSNGLDKDYYFKRPHPEFMSYSARDVEDLTEVQNRIETELSTLLTDPIIIEKLTSKNLQYYL